MLQPQICAVRRPIFALCPSQEGERSRILRRTLDLREFSIKQSMTYANRSKFYPEICALLHSRFVYRGVILGHVR
jgi:hypothetical protein